MINIKKNKNKKNNLSEGQRPNLLDIMEIQELQFQQTSGIRDVFSTYQTKNYIETDHHFTKKISFDNLLQYQFKMELQELAYGSTQAKSIENSTRNINHSVTTTDFKDNKTVSQIYQHTGCKCKKIQCLKLYCQCFAQGMLCGKNCICQNCFNVNQNKDGIQRARLEAKLRVPDSFQNLQHKMPSQVCNCKKSQCKKKYCQCFSSGAACNQFCNCKNCLNDLNIKVETFDRGSIKLKPRKTSVIRQ